MVPWICIFLDWKKICHKILVIIFAIHISPNKLFSLSIKMSPPNLSIGLPQWLKVKRSASMRRGRVNPGSKILENGSCSIVAWRINQTEWVNTVYGITKNGHDWRLNFYFRSNNQCGNTASYFKGSRMHLIFYPVIHNVYTNRCIRVSCAQLCWNWYLKD